MKKMVYVCDRCSGTINNNVCHLEGYYKAFDNNGEIVDSYQIAEVGTPDLCEDCMKEIIDCVFNNKKEVEPEQVPEQKVEKVEKPKNKKQPTKKAKRASIDVGKVFALRDAGWSVAKIADEFGCPAGSIYNVFYRQKKAEV